MALQGVILDIDGTLVLSNDANAQAWVEAFAASGYEVSFERVRPLIGMGGDQLLPQIVPGLTDEEGDGNKMEPDQVLMIGDTPYDIKSAGAAGIGVIALRCGGFDDAALAGAKAIYADSPLSETA